MKLVVYIVALLPLILGQESIDDRVRLNVTDLKKDKNRNVVKGDSDLVHTSDGKYEYYQLITPIIPMATAEDFSFKITP